jgi:hypothetical protein
MVAALLTVILIPPLRGIATITDIGTNYKPHLFLTPIRILVVGEEESMSIDYDGRCENCRNPIEGAGLAVVKDPAVPGHSGFKTVVWCAKCVKDELLHPSGAS